MTHKNSPSIDEIFQKLDLWRNLPGFRLEPLVAPFFGLFMPEILSTHLGTNPINRTVIPEFPLRNAVFRGFNKIPKNNGSKKIDYLAVTDDLEEAYLVEIKTDSNSIDGNQLKYLKKAESLGIQKFVTGIFDLARASDEKKKYVHLLHQLKELRIINSMNKVYKRTFEHCLDHNGVVAGWSNAMAEAFNNVTALDKSATQIVFILPNECDRKRLIDKTIEDFSSAKFIYFEDVAKIVKSKGKLGTVFAEHLCKWHDCEAGSRNPRRLNE